MISIFITICIDVLDSIVDETDCLKSPSSPVNQVKFG